eukprot:COSAG01_NODE_585_length_15160_cov_15.779473_14_plen_75_part_00
MIAAGGEPIVSLSLAARGWRAQRRGCVVSAGGGGGGGGGGGWGGGGGVYVQLWQGGSPSSLLHSCQRWHLLAAG